MNPQVSFHTNREKWGQIFNLRDIEDLTFDDHLQLYMWMLRFIGTGFLDENYFRSTGPIWCFLTLSNLAYVLISSGIFIKDNMGEIDKITESLTTSLCIYVIIFKGMVLLVNRTEIWGIIDVLKSFYDDARAKGGNQRKILMKRMKEGRIVTRLFYFTTIVVTLLFISCSLPKYRELALPLAAPGAFQPRRDTPYYQITYFTHIHAMMTVVCLMTGYEAVFIYSLLMLCSRLEILQNKLQEVGKKKEFYKFEGKFSDDEEAFDHDAVPLSIEMDYEYTQESLKECFQMHQNIFAFAARMNAVYRLDCLVEVVLSTLVGCVALYQVTESKNDTVYAMYLYIICCVTQIFLYCWYGDLIKVESIGVCEAIGTIPWYRINSSQRKQLQMMFLKAQQPLCISAVFGNLNLQCFTSVLRATYSYYTVLTSVHQEEE